MLDTLIAFASGGLVTSAFAHFLALSREKRARKIDFRGFLERWIGKIHRVERDTAEVVFAAYTEWIDHLWGYYRKLGGDFRCQKKFKALCMEVGSVTRKELEEHANRKQYVSQKSSDYWNSFKCPASRHNATLTIRPCSG